MECSVLFQQVFVKEHGKQKLFGFECGPYYIKPHSIMCENLERFWQFFSLLVLTFHYVCNLIHKELQSNLSPGFNNIIGKLIDVPKYVVIALWKIRTRHTHSSIDELFSIVDSTSKVVCQWFIVVLIKIALSLHLKWPTWDNLFKVKLSFKILHGIPQCCRALDCSSMRFDLSSNTKSTNWYSCNDNQPFFCFLKKCWDGDHLKFGKHCISTFIHLLDQKTLFNHIHALFHPNLVTSSTFKLIEIENFWLKKITFI